MPRFALPRRSALLIPLLLAACGSSDENIAFAPLRYNDLPPIELKVASIEIEQRFVPAGVPPDVSYKDPAPPVEALKAMANDRLMAFGTENKAVFAILNAGLTRNDDVIAGNFEVSLTILDNNGARLGFATAQVHSEHTGTVDGLRSTLYNMTKQMMSDMNVEFEYQIRRNLKPWLTSATAPDTPVEAAPLDGSPGSPPQDTQPGVTQPGIMQPGATPLSPQPGMLPPSATPAPDGSNVLTPPPGAQTP